jgi:CheY-like chemotaxis protein
MKILLIEDEKLLCDTLKDLLTAKGFQVEAVYDGETGAEYALLGIYDQKAQSQVHSGHHVHRHADAAGGIWLCAAQYIFFPGTGVFDRHAGICP